VFDTMSPPAMIKFVGTEGPSTLPAPDAAPVNRRGTKP
jgi:hypothetical protein